MLLQFLFLLPQAQAQKPGIITQPKSQNIAAGLNAKFSVAAYNGVLSYQWQFTGTNLPGATSSILAMTNIQPANAGAYRVLVSNSSGTTTSADAVLVVGPLAVWGTGTSGLTNLPLDLTNVMSIAAGSLHALALKSDGTVRAWGDNSYGQTNVPPGLAGVIAIAAGNNHCLALSADGTVTAWGDNRYGQTNVPATLGSAVLIAAGGDESTAMRTDGTITNWGFNSPVFQFQGGFIPLALAMGQAHCAAIAPGGKVKTWGQNTYLQLNVPSGLNNVVALAATGNRTLALKVDGTVAAWGQGTMKGVNP
jgi:alpha-tubulin suppressor-like RCC1 family protein